MSHSLMATLVEVKENAGKIRRVLEGFALPRAANTDALLTLNARRCLPPILPEKTESHPDGLNPLSQIDSPAQTIFPVVVFLVIKGRQ